jgi:PAS domain S-box-containing protein
MSKTEMTQIEQYQAIKQSPGRIMIVDDEPMVTASIKTLLMLDTDYDVSVFNHPVAALEGLAAFQPDVVVSDFLMPDMNGIQFLREVKTRLPEATLILLTGYSDKENAIEAINSVGIYRYIEKPWDNEQLKIAIGNGLERARLLDGLRTTIGQLTEAQEQLKKYNTELEDLVEERTHNLRSAYQTMDSIFSNTAEGILACNALGNVTMVNTKVLGWLKSKMNHTLTADHVIGNPLDQFISLTHDQSLAKLLQDLQEKPIEKIQMKDATVGLVPVEMSISPITDTLSPQESTFVIVLRDVTERREIERLRDDFMSTLTHDLRTPLLAAIQTLGFFVDGSLGPLTPKQIEILSMLINSNREMLGLVNVLLEVYKYESGRQRLILDQVNLKEMLQQVVEELSSLAQSKKQTLALKLPQNDTSLLVFADKQELRRVFMNLLGNAINYTQVEGRIQVLVSPAQVDDIEEGYAIAFQDNGRGIPEQDLPQLFQRFSQGTSKQRSSGSGLGLYLSRQIIEAHHGRISVTSKEGEGSSFEVVLPEYTMPK